MSEPDARRSDLAGTATRPVDLSDYESIARERMGPDEYAEVASFAEGNLTQRRTRAAWDALALRPGVLPGTERADLRTSVVGTEISVPFLLAPAGFHTRAHPDGERATARAAAAAGTVMVLSANPGIATDDVVAETAAPKWLQLYLFRDRAQTLRRVRFAEERGFGALCLTLDAHWPARRHGRMRRGEIPDPSSTWADPRATWEDLGWLRSRTRLPIVGKGVMSADDARRCVDAGLDAVIVSNHGGRFDNAPSTAEVLPEVVAALGETAEVYVDGGIRHGRDVVAALALGARAVLIGRPVFWGLAAGGADGLTRLLEILRDEVEAVLMQCARPSIARVDASILVQMPSWIGSGFVRPPEGGSPAAE